MLCLKIHAEYEGSNRCRKKLPNPLTQVVYFSCNVATFIFRMNHQRKHFIVQIITCIGFLGVYSNFYTKPSVDFNKLKYFCRKSVSLLIWLCLTFYMYTILLRSISFFKKSAFTQNNKIFAKSLIWLYS